MKSPLFPWYRQRPLFLAVGLIVSLALVISAFEFRTWVEVPVVMVLPALRHLAQTLTLRGSSLTMMRALCRLGSQRRLVRGARRAHDPEWT